MAITKLLLNGVEYDIGNIYEIKTEGPQLYEGRELSEYTWAQLQTKCQNADFSDLRVGDYKTITLTGGEVVKMQIAGIDTYYKTTDQSLGHHIDWISVDCLNDYVKWNTTNNNNGNSTNSYPWMVSNVYSYLNNTIYPKLPADVKAVIKNKKTNLEKRYSSSGALTDSTQLEFKEMGNLWLASEYEVFGSVIIGTKRYSQGQAVQYPLFTNSCIHKIKKRGSKQQESINGWWLATVVSGSSTHCCYVTPSGSVSSQDSVGMYADLRSPLCFRIA